MARLCRTTKISTEKPCPERELCHVPILTSFRIIDGHWLMSLLLGGRYLVALFSKNRLLSVAEVKCFRKVGNQLNISLGVLLDPVVDLEKE